MYAIRSYYVQAHSVTPSKACTWVTSSRITSYNVCYTKLLRDGYEASRQIRRWEQAQARAPIPIIALTASAFAEDRERCLAAGMDAYLSKPIDMDSLKSALASWMPAAETPSSAKNAPEPSVPAARANILLIDRPSLEQRFDADAEMMCCALESYLDEWESSYNFV